MIREYRARGVFNVINISADNAVESIKYELEAKPYQFSLTTYNADCHEERIHVHLKLPYKTLLKQFTIEMVNRIIILINSLPREGGLYSVLSSRGIITGKNLRWLKIYTKQYVQGLVGGTNDTE